MPGNQIVVSSRSGFPVSQEGASNPSSEGRSANFGLEEFPHFPADAIVRISTPLGAGSGFIFLTREDTAFVMTNAHVVTAQSSITVRVRNAEEYDAVFLGGDHIVDIAVLSVCCSDSFEEIPMGEGLKITNPVPWSDNANSAWVGDPLTVVGYPLGGYDLVATSGEILTTIQTTSGMRVVHDAIAEPGSSGSPVLSPEGRPMGVHFAGSIWGEENSFMVPFEEAEYWSSQWLPRTDPADAAVPAHQGDVTIRFTNEGIALLAAAASKVYVPDRGLSIEMVPDSAGWVWTMLNVGAMSESQVFYELINYAPKWKHEDVSADSFLARLNIFPEDCGLLAGTVRELERKLEVLDLELTDEGFWSEAEYQMQGFYWVSAEEAAELVAICPEHDDWPSLDVDFPGELLECERSALSDDWASLFTCSKPSGTDAPTPLPTNQPTAVPLEQPVADFCRSGEAIEYGAEMVVLLWNIDAARQRVFDILEEVIEDHDGVLSTAFEVRITTEIAAFEQLVADLMELSPPGELDPAYQLLEQSAAAMMDFSTALRTGKFLSSREDITEAADHWERAQDLQEAYEEKKQELCRS